MNLETYRTEKTANKYKNDRDAGKLKSLWEEECIFKNEFYKIVKNRYPYDKIYSESLLLISKHSVEKALVWAKKYAEENGYHCILWNTKLKQTIPDINHIHILKTK